jgi:hypothetical protein
MAHPTRIFKEPEELLKAFEEYKEDIKLQSNEWVKIHYVGKDGDKVKEPQKVPYTFEGFKRFCRVNYGEIEQYFLNQGDYYTDFVGVCSRIKEEIRENQIIGGLLSFYNPSITQRLNGLADSQNHNIQSEPRVFKID